MTSSLETLCQEKGVTIAAKLVRKPINPSPVSAIKTDEDWRNSAFQWTVTLKYKDKTLTTDYWTGSGLVKNDAPIRPSAAD